jgi:hypothetical protein
MKRILAEPLLHFLLLAAALFGAYGLVSKRTSGEPGSIVITQGQVASMMEAFTRTRQRPPTEEEVEGLLRDRVRDEVYAREAIALGLDKDDTVIRRRLRQKMEFVSEDVAAQVEPTDADLATYLQEHGDAFRVEPRFTFRQVYLNPEKHGEKLAGDAARMLARLNQLGDAEDVSTVGDSSLLDDQFVDVPASEVAARFGEGFAAKLGELPPSRWQGPVPSGYGLHLVFVGTRTESRAPALADVRDAVRREWTNVRRLEANERFFQELLQRYTVTVERVETPETIATTR